MSGHLGIWVNRLACEKDRYKLIKQIYSNKTVKYPNRTVKHFNETVKHLKL